MHRFDTGPCLGNLFGYTWRHDPNFVIVNRQENIRLRQLKVVFLKASCALTFYKAGK